MYGEKIKKLRKSRHLSQVQFAEKMHVSQSAVSQWETEATNISRQQLYSIANFFGVSVDYLLGNDQPDGEPEGEPAEDKSSANRRALHEIIDKFSDEDIPDVINHLKALEIVCQHKKETK